MERLPTSGIPLVERFDRRADIGHCHILDGMDWRIRIHTMVCARVEYDHGGLWYQSNFHIVYGGLYFVIVIWARLTVRLELHSGNVLGTQRLSLCCERNHAIHRSRSFPVIHHTNVHKRKLFFSSRSLEC